MDLQGFNQLQAEEMAPNLPLWIILYPSSSPASLLVELQARHKLPVEAPLPCAKDTSDRNHDSNNSESKHSPHSNHGNNNSGSNHGRSSCKSQPAVTARFQPINPKNPSTNAMIIQAKSQEIPIIPATSLWQ
ncbi:hypothetical protein D5086_025974 [Populus alba]|uniref:Uncharacterized protein n=1 Tax=Populus alba TaxID=43335 RepID=A0ACC4B147_POPAL